MYKTSPIAGLPSTINDNRNNIHFVYCRKSNLYMYVVICIIQTCDIYNNKQDCVQLIVIYNMTVWILARNDVNFSIAAGLIRLHMPGVK